MNSSEQVNELAKALKDAQSEFRPVPKSGRNPHLGNAYATLDDVIATVREPLASNGLAYTQMLTDNGAGPALTTMLMHESGQWLASTVGIDVMADHRGVNALQAFGASLTYMKRYALSAMLGVSSDEDDDASSYSGSGATRQQTATSAPGASNVSVEEARATTVNFGKYKGDTLGNIYDSDPSYVEWLAENWQWPKGKEYAYALLSSSADGDGNGGALDPKPPTPELMDRWAAIAAEAKSLGIPFEPLPDDATYDTVMGRGVALKSLIDAKKKQGRATWSPELMEKIVLEGLSTNEYSVKATLAKSSLAPADPYDKVKRWFQIYRGEREEGVESDEAAAAANKWLAGTYG